MYDTADLSNPAEMSTPELVREFVRIKQADARGELTTHVQHRRLDLIVAELRSREVLD